VIVKKKDFGSCPKACLTTGLCVAQIFWLKKTLWHSFEETLNGYSGIQNFPLEENKSLYFIKR